MPEKPGKLVPALYGGLIIGAISGLPVLNILNCFCCAGVLLGGFLSVMFYKNELTSSMPALTSSDCMQLGVFAGLFGVLVGSVLHALTIVTMGDMSSGIVLNILRNFDLPPKTLEKVEEAVEQANTLTVLMMIKDVAVRLLIDPLFGLLGGLIGFSAFKTKPTMMNVQPPPPSAQ